jgi:hypothetical protein
VPSIIADLGDETAWRYVEFFTQHPQPEHAPRVRSGL